MLDTLTIRTRLSLILLVAILSLLVMGLLTFYAMHLTQTEIDHVYFGGIEEVEKFNKMKTVAFAKILSPGQKWKEGKLEETQSLQLMREGREDLTLVWREYMSFDPQIAETLLPRQRQLAEEIRNFFTQLDQFLARGRLQDQEEGLQFLKLFTTLDLLSELYIEDTKNDYQHALNVAYWVRLGIFLSFLVALAVLIPLTTFIGRSITKPLEYAVDKISTGSTTLDSKMTASGEIGTLLEALQKMHVSVDKMISTLNAVAVGDLTVEGALRSEQDELGHALHGMIVQLRTMIGEIKREVGALTESAQEITSSLNPISSGAAETASAVTETSTTVEELKQTANLSVEKARKVLDNAEETLRSVALSEQSVLTTIEEMQQIREKMQVISDSILQLSEKGLAISDVMDSVSAIADQSNLLAVNAAIEAAKAGEFGRSFSVVAQEIRTLAEQSKGATVQVKALLSDIKATTTAAVLATEQGSKAVVKGVDQSVQTNATIKELVEKTSGVTQAANQIVISNQQQLVATEQITIAMAQIREATSQHVAHLKQIESAVNSLNQVGATLKGLTDHYQVEEGVESQAARFAMAKSKHAASLR